MVDPGGDHAGIRGGSGIFAAPSGGCSCHRGCSRCSGLPNLSGGGLLAALKDELFTLETDRLQGRLTDSEYEQQKQALELVLRRALAKKPA